MATQNSINKKTQELTVDPGASGDSFTQYSINGTGEFRIGVDDDAGDAFKISQGSALGTSDTFVMDASGRRTMPLQPAFLGYLASVDNNVTGTGTFYILGTNTALTEVFDQGGDFTTAGIFTAPITGRYLLSANVYLFDCTVATTIFLTIITSNGSFTTNYVKPAGSSKPMFLTITHLCDMDASDTAKVEIASTGEASDSNDLSGGATIRQTAFSGFLAC